MHNCAFTITVGAKLKEGMTKAVNNGQKRWSDKSIYFHDELSSFTYLWWQYEYFLLHLGNATDLRLTRAVYIDTHGNITMAVFAT
jgi:hypothetical protein